MENTPQPTNQIEKQNKNIFLIPYFFCKQKICSFFNFSKSNIILTFLPVLFFTLFLNLNLININTIKQIDEEKINEFPFSLPPIAPYPIVDSVLDVKNYEINLLNPNNNVASLLNLTAQSSIIMDNDSKVILFANNICSRFSMASTTKIMTALTALEIFELNDVLTIKTDNVNGTVVGFKKGNKFFFEDLLYAMLLPSGNDAALAIAQNYPLGEEEFIKKMNENAVRFYLFNTRFSDSTGLNDQGDYATALDLARLASTAIKNKIFAQVVATKHKVISDVEGKKHYPLNNINKLLGVDGVNGIKTGFTDEAGGVLTTSRSKDGHTTIIVVMKSKDRFADTEKLISSIVRNISYQKFNSLSFKY